MRRILLLSVVALVATAVLAGPAWASTITVTTANDEQNTDGDCSLREAIEAANTDAAVDGCAAGTGEDTIIFNLGPSATITMNTPGVPNITATERLTIDGGGAQITVSGFSPFWVGDEAKLALHRLTVADGGGFVGGAIRNEGGTVRVSNSTISGNRAAQGGGIFNTGRLTVSNSTISGNEVFSGGTLDGLGGGILNRGGTVRVSNSTISGNDSDIQGAGGGIYNDTFFGGTVTLRNTIVADSPTGGDCGGPIADGGYNLSSGHTCGFEAANHSLSGVDPMLGPLADNGGPTETRAPVWTKLQRSPAIDRGDSFGASTDQRGLKRPSDFGALANAAGGDGSDIGALEVQNRPPTIAVAAGGRCLSHTSARGSIELRISDDAGAADVSLRATSSNRQLVPDSTIAFSGSGQNRTMTLSALDGKSGTALITITASDARLLSTRMVSVKVGTNGANAINGTARADMLFGLGAADALVGLGSNDLLCAGKGVDALVGSSGDDTLFGGPGKDTLRGANGGDTLSGGTDNDRLFGDNGADRLGGGAGADHFSGGAGSDTATDFDRGEGDTKDSTIP